MESQTKKFNIEDFTENRTEEITVSIPSFNNQSKEERVVKVRLPKNREKFEVKRELSKILGDGIYTDLEKDVEYSRLLAIKMIQDEPKPSVEQYLNAEDSQLTVILDAVAFWYASKLRLINEARGANVDAFLGQKKEELQ